MTRDELLAPILAAVPGAVASMFDDWDVIPGVVNGEHVCTAIMSGSEIHFAIKPEHQRKLIRRRNTAEFLQPLIERCGFLTTKVLCTSKEANDFVSRMGFERLWSDGQFNYYLMNELPFALGGGHERTAKEKAETRN